MVGEAVLILPKSILSKSKIQNSKIDQNKLQKYEIFIAIFAYLSHFFLSSIHVNIFNIIHKNGSCKGMYACWYCYNVAPISLLHA